MNYLLKLFIEATVVGIGLIIVGSLIAYAVRNFYPKPVLPKSCQDLTISIMLWNLPCF